MKFRSKSIKLSNVYKILNAEQTKFCVCNEKIFYGFGIGPEKKTRYGPTCRSRFSCYLMFFIYAIFLTADSILNFSSDFQVNQ
jgi:hypothetical protein